MSADSNPATPTAEPAPPAAAAGKPPCRRRWLKWTLVTLGALALLVALLPTLLSTSVARGAIHSWLRDNVDRKVEFASLDLGWFSGIRLEGVEVGDESGGPL